MRVNDGAAADCRHQREHIARIGRRRHARATCPGGVWVVPERRPGAAPMPTGRRPHADRAPPPCPHGWACAHMPHDRWQGREGRRRCRGCAAEGPREPRPRRAGARPRMRRPRGPAPRGQARARIAPAVHPQHVWRARIPRALRLRTQWPPHEAARGGNAAAPRSVRGASAPPPAASPQTIAPRTTHEPPAHSDGQRIPHAAPGYAPVSRRARSVSTPEDRPSVGARQYRVFLRAFSSP